MNSVAVGQFIRGNAGLIAGLLALCVSILLFLQRRARRHQQSQQGLAACWHATLSELSASLNGMQVATHRLIRNHQRPGPIGNVYNSEILAHRWLSEGFVAMAAAKGCDCKELVQSMQKDLALFNWNINQATNAKLRGHGVMLWNQANRNKLKRLVDVFDVAAIRLACNRHRNMVSMWKESDEMRKEFCRTNNLAEENDLETPGSIPPDWQMDESEPWMIKNLALVGDKTW